MSHRRIKHKLGHYLEGDLAHGAHRRVERHLADCSECSEELRGLERTRRLLRELPTPEPPPNLAEAVMARLRAGEVQPGPAARLGAWWADFSAVGWPVPIAAVATALVAVAVLNGGDTDFVWGAGEPAVSTAAVAPLAPERDATLVRSPGALPPSARGPSGFVADTPGDRSPFRACLDHGITSRDCIRLHAWTVALAAGDPQAFAVELESLPPRAREAWRQSLQAFQAQSPEAPLLAREPSRSPAAAPGVAIRFQTGSAAPRP